MSRKFFDRISAVESDTPQPAEAAAMPRDDVGQSPAGGSVADAASNDRPLTDADVLSFCIESLADVCAIIAPTYMARVGRIGQIGVAVAVSLGVSQPERLQELAFLSQLGSMTLPESVLLKLHRGELLTSNEREAVRSTPRLGEEILGRLRGYEHLQEIVRLHNVHEVPVGDLPIEAAVLRVAIGYDRQEAAGEAPAAAIAVLRGRAPMYSEEVLDHLERFLGNPSLVRGTRCVMVSELDPGMVLSADLIGRNGVLQLGAGHRLSAIVIGRLVSLVSRDLILNAVEVHTSTPDGA